MRTTIDFILIVAKCLQYDPLDTIDISHEQDNKLKISIGCIRRVANFDADHFRSLRGPVFTFTGTIKTIIYACGWLRQGKTTFDLLFICRSILSTFIPS